MSSLSVNLSSDVVRSKPQVIPIESFEAPSIVGERLTLTAFNQIAGMLGGYPFIKLVVDRHHSSIHFINNAKYPFHANYIAEQILSISKEELESKIDSFNQSFYFDDERRFFLGVLALHKSEQRHFFSLETVEVDTMNAEMIKAFYRAVKENLDPSAPVFFKPANHFQETLIVTIDATEVPRVFSHELFSTSHYIALNAGVARGRIRAFRSESEYRQEKATIEWHDIIVMDRVPDDIPRVSGIINSKHTTPLSHTNVLASGWQIPNAIELKAFKIIDRDDLNNQWVEYTVSTNASEVLLKRIERPTLDEKPAWSVQKITLEEPEIANTPIVGLDFLRMSDRHKYGTKAANLGELKHVLNCGSDRLTAFYRIPRPPRPNLLYHLAKLLDAPSHASPINSYTAEAVEFLRSNIKIPRGIAIPFSVQQEFLCSSPKIQQAIGKLKMALELNVRQVDALCVTLQQMIRSARIPDKIRDQIDSQISSHLGGVSSFVVRSSSNAEDLENFSAAGIYESFNHVTTADRIFESIKQVWGSLLSPRSVRLRHEVGISLDDSYMGVVIQEEVKSHLGGVLVTTNPLNRHDFRNVYLNISPKSVVQIVQGSELPLQYLYNTVEGGGRTLSIGEAQHDLNDADKNILQKLSVAGRLLQSHFSPDYTFSSPVDIEWLCGEEGLYILQLRPYSK